jgi:tetratricopeptide (TPR) repeat protein
MQGWRWVLVLMVLMGWGMPVGVVAQSIDELFRQGIEAQEAGRFSEAVKLRNRVSQQELNNASAYNNIGVDLLNQGKLEEAIAAFRQAIQLDPSNAIAYNGLGAALGAQRKLEEAIAAFRQAIQLNPNYVLAYNNFGNALREQGKVEEAIAAFRQAIQLDPNYVLAYNNLGYALSDQGKLEEAIAAFRQAIQLDPKSVLAYGNLGLALYDQGKLEEAITAYRQVIQLDPKSAGAYYHLGIALYDQGQLEEAIVAYRQAIQLDPKFADAYNILGAALREQGKLEEAVAAFHQVTQLAPKFADAYNILGAALREQGKLEEAIAAFRQAIQLDPNYVLAYNNLGLTLYDQGKLEEAITAYRQALSLFDVRATPASAHTLAYNGLGYALQHQGKFSEAIEFYQRAIALDSNYAKAQNNLREAQRLLSLQRNPQPNRIDDTAFLPQATDEPLLPVLRSTARIISTQSDGFSIGTGWVVKRQGDTVWIVTNRHVISDDQTQRTSTKIEVEFFSNLPDTQRPRYTTMIEQITAPNDGLDLAVLKVSGIPADIKPLTIRSGSISRNTPIRAIGHPDTGERSWTSSPGEIINYNPNTPIIPIDASLAQGNSGGPIVNQQMEVIAMMVRIRGSQDIATDPNEPTPLHSASEPAATRAVGLAYRIDIILERLKTWRIID